MRFFQFKRKTLTTLFLCKHRRFGSVLPLNMGGKGGRRGSLLITEVEKIPKYFIFFLLLHCIQDSLKWKWASLGKKFQTGLCWLTLLLSPCLQGSRTPLEGRGGGKPLTTQRLVLPTTLTAPECRPRRCWHCAPSITAWQSMAKMCLTFCFGLKLMPVSLSCFESRPSTWGRLSQPTLLRQVQ